MTNTIKRPWGSYINLYESEGYKVKKIFVEPNQKISLQYHLKRSEHWVIVGGNGTLTLDDNLLDVSVGKQVFIPEQSIHRIESGNSGIIIIEVQLGSECLEDDIIRIQDDYGRV